MKRSLLTWLLLWSAGSWAGFMTGNETRSLCEQPRPACIAYLMGVVDGIEAMGWEKVNSGLCVPEHVETADVREILLDYTEADRELLGLPGGLLVLYALKQAWACEP